jgi:hypothetical protein
MSPGLESGLFAIIGAAVGASGAVLAGIAQTVSASRANRARIAAEAAAAKTAVLRPLYEQLISATHEARRLFVELHSDIKSYIKPSGTASRAFEDMAAHIYSCVTAVRIDGSDKASNVAQKLNSDILFWLEQPRRYEEHTINEIIGKVEKAEEDLTIIARAETGSAHVPNYEA